MVTVTERRPQDVLGVGEGSGPRDKSSQDWMGEACLVFPSTWIARLRHTRHCPGLGLTGPPHLPLKLL